MKARLVSGLALAGLMALGATALAQANYQSFSLGANFLPDPQTGNGTTGGSVDASTISPACLGNVSASPDHQLTITSAVNLKIFVDSTVDSTLVITGPGGFVLCDDDSNGNLDPQVNNIFQPGTYNIHVGHLGDTAGAYTITFTENM